MRTFERRGSPTPTWRRIAAFAAGLALIAVGAPLAARAHRAHLAPLRPPAPERDPGRLGAAAARARPHAGDDGGRASAAGSCGPLTAPPVALTFWLAAWYVLHVPAVYGYALDAPLGARARAPRLPRRRASRSGGRCSSPGRMRAAGPARLPVRRVHRRRARRARTRPHAAAQYDFYVHAPRLWGLSPLEDQQIGAIAMAIEQAAILFAACSIALHPHGSTRTTPATPAVGFDVSTIRAACVQFRPGPTSRENVALTGAARRRGRRPRRRRRAPAREVERLAGRAARCAPQAERIDARRDGRRDGRTGRATHRRQPDRRLDRDRRRRRRRVHNVSIAYDRDGERVAAYTKIHLFDVDVGGISYRESDGTAPGSEPSSRDLDGVRSA